MATQAQLDALRNLLHEPGRIGQERQAVCSAAGELRLGALHEWFGFASEVAPGRWSPPLCVLVDIARRAVCGEPGLLATVVWVGRRCWPSPLHLGPALLEASMYIDAPDHASRLWCAEVACRCEHPTLVIVDGSTSTLAHTRRLQLAAGAGRGVCVLARPPWEERELSSASTRWRVSREVSVGRSPRWSITLLRDKERARAVALSRVVELDHAEGLVVVPPAVGAGEVCAPARAG